MYSSRKGLFVVIEGIDGSGKTTIAKKLVEKLKSMGYEAEYTYEPFASPFSQALKQYIDTYGGAEPEIEALAMALDRLYHIRKVVLPLLNEGFIVISDRYLYSSIAYQGARGIDLDWIYLVNRYAIEPDVAIYLRVPFDIALERKKQKESKWSYFEDIDRLKKAQDIYEKLVLLNKLVPVDASRKVDDVINECLNIIFDYLGKRKH
ncbi:MAG: dTMP kinase [Ignisphaera sp.]